MQILMHKHDRRISSDKSRKKLKKSIWPNGISKGKSRCNERRSTLDNLLSN